jgi:hypothetical protein
MTELHPGLAKEIQLKVEDLMQQTPHHIKIGSIVIMVAGKSGVDKDTIIQRLCGNYLDPLETPVNVSKLTQEEQGCCRELSSESNSPSLDSHLSSPHIATLLTFAPVKLLITPLLQLAGCICPPNTVKIQPALPPDTGQQPTAVTGKWKC